MTEHLGGCACGQVRYRLRSDPMFTHCCHCRFCQQQTGAAFIVHAVIETDRVEVLSGRTTLFPMPAGSGQSHSVARCPACGTQVWSQYHATSTLLSWVKVGTLDNPAALPPGAHMYTRTKLPWVTLPADVPAFATTFDRETIWPAESLARRRLALG